jgi:nucleotide-binding universal stress UspA family protein
MERQAHPECPPAPDHRPIVCGVERTGEGTAAPQVAAELAERLGTRLVLVLVIPPPSMATAGMAAQMSMLHDRAVEHGRSVLAGVVDDLAGASGDGAAEDAEGRVEFGEPAPRLAATADELDAELIVVGARGRRPAGVALLGSVSQDLAAEETRPVMVVSPEAGHEHRAAGLTSRAPDCIVCGVDESEQAARAASVSGRLAGSLGVRLVLVHVQEGGVEDRLLELVGGAPRATAAPPWLRQLERAMPLGPERVESRLATGDPAKALEAVAVHESAAFVAVGTRGHGALRSLALRSVSRALASSCSRPVLVVNEPHSESTGS